jgi:hypothetical protein
VLTFKEQLDDDLTNVFINHEEFADVHHINGKEMLIALDGDELEQRKLAKSGDYTVGVYEGDLLFYVREDVYGHRPRIEEENTFDGEKYRVTDFTSDTGLYTIVLKKNTSMQMRRQHD